MSPWGLKAIFPVIATALILWRAPASGANDTAASVGAGGIQFVHEVRVSMEKEKLTISDTKITVDYEFLNETNQDITTEVAFPIPPYTCIDVEECPNEFNDFRVTIESQTVMPSTDIKAMVGQRDYSELLREFKIDAASFGHYDVSGVNKDQRSDIERLSNDQRRQLMDLGLITADAFHSPLWTVVKTYHWTQTFPAGKVIHISHQYRPVTGYEDVPLKDLSMKFPDACIDSALQRKLTSETSAYLQQQEKPAYSDYYKSIWVEYILTTANNWKKPIKDFELVLERPQPVEGVEWSASLCWNGRVTRIDPNHFSAHVKDFVPTKNLIVYYFLKDQEVLYEKLDGVQRSR